MPELLAELVVSAIIVYASVGVVFALAFASHGAGVIDPRAAGAGRGFRMLILPGSAIFWPLLAVRWTRAIRRDT